MRGPVSTAAARSLWRGATSSPSSSRYGARAGRVSVFPQHQHPEFLGVVSSPLLLLRRQEFAYTLNPKCPLAVAPSSLLRSFTRRLLLGGRAGAGAGAGFHRGVETGAMAPGLEAGGAGSTTVSDGIGGGGGGGGRVEERAVDRVAIIGSGNWGCVAARLAATNARRLPTVHDEVRVWVFEETVANGELLTDVINRTQENVKYLPNIKLGPNVVADPDLESAAKNATLLVFVTPHQFVQGICRILKGKIRSDAKAISLIKGMELRKDGPRMISNVIREELGIDCSVLMGANIANEVAMEQFSEATVGYRKDKQSADQWVQLFGTPYFWVTSIEDVEGVELCGTLKNVVAIAAGLVDGLNLGNNTKAAIMRIGLHEMILLSKRLFPSVKDATFLESCGVADLITTCFGGRNRKVAEAFARAGGKRSFEVLEHELLNGQKLQGVLTAKEVYEVLKARNWEESFPLFSTVRAIAVGLLPPSAIVTYIERTPLNNTGTSGRIV